jgi:hypothetical protein
MLYLDLPPPPPPPPAPCRKQLQRKKVTLYRGLIVYTSIHQQTMSDTHTHTHTHTHIKGNKNQGIRNPF